MTMYLSRVSISRQPSIQALNALLLPDHGGDRVDAHHRLLWTLFADGPDRRRDFLWREESAGEFLILSRREPMHSDLFSRVDVKPYEPSLAVGDRLIFALRANATRKKKGAGRVDVVMNALFALPSEKRAENRMRMARTEGTAWLLRQGDTNGFSVLNCDVTDYSVHALPSHRGARKGQPQFGILDLQGSLEVKDPAALLQALINGIGRAKAFGCGLMLVRRAI